MNNIIAEGREAVNESPSFNTLMAFYELRHIVRSELDADMEQSLMHTAGTFYRIGEAILEYQKQIDREIEEDESPEFYTRLLSVRLEADGFLDMVKRNTLKLCEIMSSLEFGFEDFLDAVEPGVSIKCIDNKLQLCVEETGKEGK